MQITNAAPESENNASNEETSDAKNPAANFGKYHAEFGYKPLNADQLNEPEVPEIRVNGALIDEASILGEMQFHPADTKQAAMSKATEALIVSELLRQKALEFNYLSSDTEVNSAEEAAGLETLIENHVTYPKATKEECKRFFEANQNRFMTSPLLEVRHILLAAAPEDVNERLNLKKVAEKLIEILTNEPSTFAELAQRHSACPSKEQKGNLGQITKGQTVPEFERALFASNEGLIGYPLESRYGFHIVFIDRKVEGLSLPYDIVQDKVSNYLNDKVQRKATAHYIQTLIEGADIIGYKFDIEAGLMQ